MYYFIKNLHDISENKYLYRAQYAIIVYGVGWREDRFFFNIIQKMNGGDYLWWEEVRLADERHRWEGNFFSTIV